MQPAEKPSKFGIISFILAILIGMFWCIYIVVFSVVTKNNLNFGMDSGIVAVILVYGGGLVMAMLTLLCTFAGMTLGIIALRKGEPKRGFAIAGMLINLLWLTPYCFGIFRVFSAPGI